MKDYEDLPELGSVRAEPGTYLKVGGKPFRIVARVSPYSVRIKPVAPWRYRLHAALAFVRWSLSRAWERVLILIDDVFGTET